SANVHHVGDRVDLDRAAGANDALVAALDPAPARADLCAAYAARIAAANSDLHRQVIVYAVVAAFLAAVILLVDCRALARVCRRLAVRALAMAPQRTNKKDGPDELPFPIPGKFQEDGQLAVELIDVSVLTIKRMKEMLRGFQRPLSGNSEALKQRLKEYSADRSAWDVLLPSVSTNLKASRTNKPKTKREKSWTTRRNKLFSNGEDAVSGPRRVAEVDEGILAAAARVCAANPYRPPVEYIRRTCDGSLPENDSIRQRAIANVAPPSSANPATIPTAQAIVQGVLDGLLQHQLPTTISTSDTDTLARTPTTSAPSQEMDVPCTEGGDAAAHMPPPIDSHSAALSSLPRRTLYLPPLATRTSEGLLLEFTDNEVQAPAGGIGCDVERIACMWAFDSHWRRDSPLTIRGHPIPLSMWPELFKHRKPELWTYYKSHFIKWRDVATEWRKFPSPAHFWERYSTGLDPQRKRKTFTQIVNEVLQA
ncbi:hypothetical protein EV714DRAFT_167153, partial [Schizophyllum commune]